MNSVFGASSMLRGRGVRCITQYVLLELLKLTFASTVDLTIPCLRGVDDHRCAAGVPSLQWVAARQANKKRPSITGTARGRGTPCFPPECGHSRGASTPLLCYGVIAGSTEELAVGRGSG